MRNLRRTPGFPGPNLIEGFSSFFLLQGLFSSLPVIADVLVSDEFGILCTHDFPSYGFSRWNYTLRDILPV
jgi:hypothetical protein